MFYVGFIYFFNNILNIKKKLSVILIENLKKDRKKLN